MNVVMKWTYFLILAAAVRLCNCLMRCNIEDKKCLCIPTQMETELQCPPNFNEVGGFIVHIDYEKNVQIDCFEPNPQFFDIDLLPNMTLGKNPKFKIRFCPLPESTFKKIIDNLGVSNVKHLRFESFKSNSIILNKHHFEGLIDLKSLYLDANNLVNLDEDIFINTPHLIKIDLQRNSIMLKPKLFHSTPLLESLDISQNGLENLPRGLFQNLRNLENLLLWHNNLSGIDEFTFDGLINLKVLELTLNRISEIKEDAFKNLKKLRQIGLSKNKLTVLSSNLFQHNEMLNTIAINDNFNLSLPDYLFANLHLLKEVQIKNCHLVSIPEHIFENSSNIEILNLDNNFLNHLPKKLFKGFESLKTLSLQNNKISQLITFPKSLNKLCLGQNLITTIEADAFINLQNLEEIYLRKNQISDIHCNVFNRIYTLKIIDLSHNKISEGYKCPIINYRLFENVMEVTHINLSHNFITRIEDVINMNNKVKLKTLDLTHNYIKSVTIADLHSLQTSGNNLEVKLDWNNITTVDFFLADQLVSEEQFSLKHASLIPYTNIYLAHNPLTCDCHNYDLFRYFHNEMPISVQILFRILQKDLLCMTPSKYKNFPVSQFQPSWAVC